MEVAVRTKKEEAWNELLIRFSRWTHHWFLKLRAKEIPASFKTTKKMKNFSELVTIMCMQRILRIFDDGKIIVKQTFSKDFFCDLFLGYTFSLLMSDDLFLGMYLVFVQISMGLKFYQSKNRSYCQLHFFVRLLISSVRYIIGVYFYRLEKNTFFCNISFLLLFVWYLSKLLLEVQYVIYLLQSNGFCWSRMIC